MKIVRRIYKPITPGSQRVNILKELSVRVVVKHKQGTTSEYEYRNIDKRPTVVPEKTFIVVEINFLIPVVLISLFQQSESELWNA